MSSTSSPSPLIEEPNEFPPWVLFSQLCLRAIVIAIPLSKFQYSLIIGYHVFWLLNAVNYDAGSHQANFVNGSAVSIMLFWVISLILMDPTKFRRLDGFKGDGIMLRDEKVPAWKRWAWSFYAATSMRGIGWGFQIKTLPKGHSPTYSRTKFVVKNLLIASLWILATQIGNSYLWLHPYNELTSKSSWLEISAFTIASTIRFFAAAGPPIPYHITAAMTTLLFPGVVTPADWPPILGNFLEAWSVRRFWSIPYHHMLRISVEVPTEFFLRKVLQIPHGTPLSNYGKIFGGLFISFFIHAWGDWCMCQAINRRRVVAMKAGMSLPNSLLSTSDMIWGDFRLFMGQAVIILLEDMIIRAWRMSQGGHRKRLAAGKQYDEIRTKPEDTSPYPLSFERMIGYTWTATWLIWSAIRWQSPMMEKAPWDEEPKGLNLGDEFWKRFSDIKKD